MDVLYTSSREINPGVGYILCHSGTRKSTTQSDELKFPSQEELAHEAARAQFYRSRLCAREKPNITAVSFYSSETLCILNCL